MEPNFLALACGLHGIESFGFDSGEMFSGGGVVECHSIPFVGVDVDVGERW